MKRLNLTQIPFLEEKNALNFKSHKELRLLDKTLSLFREHGRLLAWHIVPFM